MSRSETLDRIPGHLRRYVVQQDYDAYDAVDHAVWRFVLLQTFSELKETAHPTYVEGLEKTGIFIDRIPSIDEMDACLSKFGWSAVCVDGFIPPRAFQEFQALRILTIATEMRTADHLAYTPAPDIIHESAGHAPIIPDADYRRFLEHFGEIGSRAFSCKEDLEVYEAIRHLSEVKEDIASTPDIIKAAEERLDRANAAVNYISEATILARLHWWTVEYGLVGSPNDYKIFGAAILSSVGESRFLHEGRVEKIPLSKDCVDYGYDITTQQPQLFVAEDFAHLDRVLAEVTAGFAFKVGGRSALEKFKRSGEVGTATLDTGLEIMGELVDFLEKDGTPFYLQFTGPCALGYQRKMLEGHHKEHHAQGYGTPIGALADGRTGITQADLTDLKDENGRVRLEYQSGVVVDGDLESMISAQDGRLLIATFKDCTVTHGERRLFEPEWGVFDCGFGEKVVSARAGASDMNYHPTTEFSKATVPKAKRYSDADKKLLGLYKKVTDIAASGDQKSMATEYPIVLNTLKAEYPNHWLLPWYMLDHLKKAKLEAPFKTEIIGFMKEIESRNYREVPVSTGLRFLGIAV